MIIFSIFAPLTSIPLYNLYIMRKAYLIWMAGFLALFAGCSQEEILIPDPPQDRVPTRVSIQDALKNADKMFENIYGIESRANTRKVKSVQYHGSLSTRSGEETPLYYVVNYENEGGFAVLGADTRLDPVYAISNEGHLDMNDTTFNEGLSIFFDGLSSIGIANPDSLYVRPDPDPYIKDPQPDIPPTQPTFVGHKVLPLLTTAVSQWSQYYPFNAFCPMIAYQYALVGCTNVAAGQIMAFYEHPTVYSIYQFDWYSMKEWIPQGYIPENGVPRLLSELGKEGNFNTSYGIDASGSNTKQYYKRTFRNFGYKTPGDFKSFSETSVDSYLKKNKPVFLRGTHYTTLSDGGHAWVCDGVYYDYWKGEDIFGEMGFYGQGYFFHMVWGWGGSSNGYYKYGVTSLSGYSQYSSTNDNVSSSVPVKNIEYCGDFTPDK